MSLIGSNSTTSFGVVAKLLYYQCDCHVVWRRAPEEEKPSATPTATLLFRFISSSSLRKDLGLGPAKPSLAYVVTLGLSFPL